MVILKAMLFNVNFPVIIDLLLVAGHWLLCAE